MKGFKSDTRSAKELRDLPHAADILDYSPPSYCASPEWLTFQKTFEEEAHQILDHTSPDDLNSEMFDSAIDAALQSARDFAARQHVDHLAMIHRRQDVLKDRVTQSILFRSLLEEDLSEIDGMLAALPAPNSGSIRRKGKGGSQ